MCKTLTLLCAISMLVPGCGGTPGAPDGMRIAVQGRVTDYATGSPVTGVGASFGEQRVTTDSDGRFVVRVPVGGYDLQVDGEPSAAHILVRGPWSRADYLAHPLRCGTRYGSVTDKRTGRPIAGAVVSAGIPTTTDATGWYRIDGGCDDCGSCNTIFMTVTARGYADQSFILGRGFTNVARQDVEM